jgi:hypothetical protein
MTLALMIPAMRATTTMRNVAAAAVAVAADVGDMRTAQGIMSVDIAIMTEAHAISTEGGMDVNHGTTIAAMMIGGTEL